MLRAESLVIHVDHDQLVLRVFESEQLREGFVSGYVWCRKVDGFLDVPPLVLLLVSEIQQDELSFGAHSLELRSQSRGN